jgi:hypothetical protein
MTNRSVNIIKSTGDVVPFSIEKLENSLKRSGADEATIGMIANEVASQLRDGMTTRDVYKFAFKLLKKRQRPAACKYSLKRAIMEMGPTGFPFEKFVGELLANQGYAVKTDQVLQGKCVQHEIDIIAENADTICIIECKYHNGVNTSSDVKIPLYVHSRFRDVMPEDSKKRYECWVVTNTQFTHDAIQYGECAGLHLLSWDHPKHAGIMDMADGQKMYPVTCLTLLTKKEKGLLMAEGIVSCADLIARSGVLEGIRITGTRMENIIREAMSLGSAMA